MSQDQPTNDRETEMEVPAERGAPPAEETNLEAALQDLTVAQLIGLLLKRPSRTAQDLRGAPIDAPIAAPAAEPAADTAVVAPAVTVPEPDRPPLSARLAQRLDSLLQPRYLQLLLYALAILFAYTGSVYARGTADIRRDDYFSMNYAAPYLWAGFLLWLLAEAVGNWTRLRAGWQALDQPGRARWLARLLPALTWIIALFLLGTSLNAPEGQRVGMALIAILTFAAGGITWLLINLGHWWYRRRMIEPSRRGSSAKPPELIAERIPLRRPVWREISPLRMLMFVTAFAGSLYVWDNSGGNSITLEAIQVWIGSALLWCFVFAPLRWNILDFASDAIDRWRRMRWRKYRWAMILFALLMILGFSFRYDMLEQMPRYLYSDMVINILDAWDVYNEDRYLVFFSYNGGREPLYIYLLSVFASQPGMNFDGFALVHYSALWSLLSLPLFFWFGVETFAGMRRGRRAWALTAGLIVMGLMAASFWHVVLGRQGMRVSPLTFFLAATMIFYMRALRANRRTDFVLAGLFLGLGLYTYPSIRFIPISIVIGVFVTLLLRRHSWRQRAKYLLNLAVLAVITLAVFVPLLRYWNDYPQEFTRRAGTRLFGETPTSVEEREEMLLESGSRYLKNLHQMFLIYHYYGEATWVTANRSEPAMDPFAAAFMTLGAAAWLSLMATRRDPFVWHVPIFLLVALLPTSLALAFPIEVPSFSRANAAMLPSYLIAALPLAVFCRQLYRCMPRVPGIVAGVGFGALIILASNDYNANNYFGFFRQQYNRSSHPTMQAGAALRGYLDSGGAVGNVFAADTPHWWDHRAVGIEAGLRRLEYQAPARDLPRVIRRNYEGNGAWRLDPDRDLFIFYAQGDSEAPTLLREWFPHGRSQQMEAQHPSRDFFVYRVPALGADGMQAFVDEYA